MSVTPGSIVLYKKRIVAVELDEDGLGAKFYMDGGHVFDVAFEDANQVFRNLDIQPGETTAVMPKTKRQGKVV